VMAQRLIRRLCPHCKEAYQPDPDELPDDFPIDQMPSEGLYRAVGCRTCRGVGFSGRMGIYELLTTTDDIRQLAHDRASSWKIKHAAIKQGMPTLRGDGWLKVLAGSSTIEEVVRVTKGDREMMLTEHK
ncbi:MAG TPA: type II/IV secretion system protein, partial [Pirellulaceae bacterium]|nr:type II/IV secretion system protein [Pirellulaceae bacterium]